MPLNMKLEMTRSATLSTKVCGPYGVTLLNQTTIFEWYMTRLVVVNIYT